MVLESKRAGNFSITHQTRATITEVTAIKGNQLNFNITFNVDWNEQTLNGTIKDEVHRMRIFKGFKL